MNLSRAIAMAGCVLCLSALPASSQTVMERVDLSAVQKIRDEGLNRSKLDDLASYLTDVIGARLTNSPGSRKANEWAAETFRSWGLANVKVGEKYGYIDKTGKTIIPPQYYYAGTFASGLAPVVQFLRTPAEAERQPERAEAALRQRRRAIAERCAFQP